MSNTKFKQNNLDNGFRIPSDEVLIINEKEQDFKGTVLGMSTKVFKSVGTSQRKAIRGLEEIALRHIANALVHLKIRVKPARGRDYYTAKAQIAQVAVPIPFGEITPVGTLLEYSMPKEEPPGRVYFSLEEAEGSAEYPPVNTFFSTLEEARESLCFKLFDEKIKKTGKSSK